MDPLGFALENFDGVGMWRDKDRFANAPIDSVGELPDGTKINGPDDLRNALLAHLVAISSCRRFVENLLTYSMGRTRRVLRHCRPSAGIVRETQAKDYRFSAILQAVGQKRSVQNAPRSATRADPSAKKIEYWEASKETRLCSYRKKHIGPPLKS